MCQYIVILVCFTVSQCMLYILTTLTLKPTPPPVSTLLLSVSVTYILSSIPVFEAHSWVAAIKISHLQKKIG